MFDEDNNDPTVDLSTARMKCMGAKRIVQLYEYIADKPHMTVNGFKCSVLGLLDDDNGIPQQMVL